MLDQARLYKVARKGSQEGQRPRDGRDPFAQLPNTHMCTVSPAMLDFGNVQCYCAADVTDVSQQIVQDITHVLRNHTCQTERQP